MRDIKKEGAAKGELQHPLSLLFLHIRLSFSQEDALLKS
jgi:hypothetical protein